MSSQDTAEFSARLLIVDDEATLMGVLCDTLQEHGYETVGVTTGAAALAALHEAPFDLLLVDLQMPEMDGITLLRAALAMDPTLVGLIMTGEGTIASAVAAMQTGALDYILKPFKMRDILPVLARALTVRRLRLENAALGQHLTERTTELQAANQQLAQANLAKDRFLASMSHELRTPLNSIIGFTGILLMCLPGPLTPDQDRQLHQIDTSAKYLLSLISDLLDLTKIASGTVDLHLERVVCQGVIQDVVASLRPLAAAKEIALDLALPDHDLVVQANPRALRQILLNLVTNAIKFTEQGTVAIALCQRQDEAQSMIEMRVMDTGIGIRPEDHGRLFQAFTRLDTAQACRPEGTGLGLHLSQKLAGLLGGQIRVQSAYGTGSTFTLDLPAA